jgi:N-methylhydantoinase A/oxoprolinase/acetone carboxylase beta subunit
MRIGIDVGGTNTDAVLVDGERVLAEVKTATTADVTGGIVDALQRLVAAADVAAGDVRAVMIGTTHFTNAVVEAKRLLPTAIVRLGLPATSALPPMVDWPARLRDALGGHVFLAHGGHEFDGSPIAPLRPDELRGIAEEIGRRGVRTVAISSVFSPVNDEFEREAAELLAAELPGVAISRSHEIGRIGLLERENAAIMNACLRDLATAIVAAFGAALEASGIDAPVYLSQNDGTLMTVGFAERYPVATFASGPTNSMRGAAVLSGLRDCAVVDIGGTTSDVGMLVAGFPRQAAANVDIGGVRTNFRMPDVVSIGLGGGSIVRPDGGLTIGPDSVGFRLTEEARVFGGGTLTSSDVAVAAGRADFGDASAVADLPRALVEAALALMERTIAEAVDRAKTSAEPIPVVLVGGGSVLLGDSLPGASQLVRPDHHAVANAVGAAIAQVGGETDRVWSIGPNLTREQALEQATAEAHERAVEAGAAPDSVEILDVEELALGYVPGNAVRIKVKAVGDLELGRLSDAAHR